MLMPVEPLILLYMILTDGTGTGERVVGCLLVVTKDLGGGDSI